MKPWLSPWEKKSKWFLWKLLEKVGFILRVVWGEYWSRIARWLDSSKVILYLIYTASHCTQGSKKKTAKINKIHLSFAYRINSCSSVLTHPGRVRHRHDLYHTLPWNATSYSWFITVEWLYCRLDIEILIS